MIPEERKLYTGVVHMKNDDGTTSEFTIDSIIYTVTPSIVEMDDYAKDRLPMSKTYSISAKVKIHKSFYMRLYESKLIQLGYSLPKKKRLRNKKVKELVKLLQWLN